VTDLGLIPNCSAISRYFSDVIRSKVTSSSRGVRTENNLATSSDADRAEDDDVAMRLDES